MPEENEETKETQETQENPNEVSTPEDLEAVKAQLEEEKKAKVAADQALSDVSARLAEKDARIAELETSLSEAKTGSEAAAAELAQVKESHGQAVAKYLDAVRLANPTIPPDIITGDTIEDIVASVQKAQSIAESVKANLEAQAKEAKVPAGAPPRGEISIEGLSPREKIAAGIQQKGGGAQ
jgi:ATP/maltotriose-dependent transcriptional regulator MalT